MSVVSDKPLRQYAVHFVVQGPVSRTRYTDFAGHEDAFYDPHKSGSPQIGQACCHADAWHEHQVEVYVLASTAAEARELATAAIAQIWIKGFRVAQTAIKRSKIDLGEAAFPHGVTYMGEM